MIRRLIALFVPWVAFGCAGSGIQSQPSTVPRQAVSTLDSIRLERTLCYGTCPAYRLQLDHAGRIRFFSLNPGDSGRSAQDSVSPEALLYLQREAERIGFFALPDSLVGTALCADWATDHPTVTVTVFRREGVKRVVDYHGCFERSDHSVRPVVAQLRTFERIIDGVTGSFRWVRPAPSDEAVA